MRTKKVMNKRRIDIPTLLTIILAIILLSIYAYSIIIEGVPK